MNDQIVSVSFRVMAVPVILDLKVIQGFKEKTEIMVLQEILASQGCLGCQDPLASKVTLEKKVCYQKCKY